MTNEQNTPAPPDDALTERLRFTAKDARFHGYEGNAVLMEAAADAIAKMSLAISPASGYADWVMVPMEATEEMWEAFATAGNGVYDEVTDHMRFEGDIGNFRYNFASALAAAPKPAAPPSVTDAVEAALSHLKVIADNAYVDGCHQHRKTECLGREHKLAKGTFGEAEYRAHEIAIKHFARHFAIHEAIKAIRASLAALTHPGHKHAQEDAAQRPVKDGWRVMAHEMLHRLETMQPPNVVLQQVTMLGEMAALLRCIYPIDSEAK